MIIKGKIIADKILEEIREKVFVQHRKLVLGAVLVGDDSALKKFVDLKAKASEKAGINFKYFNFPEDIETGELSEKIKQICNLGEVSGLLVELPLPKHINQQEILDSVAIEKDVDVLSDEAQQLFYENKSVINPPAVEALKVVLDEYGINLVGKTAAVFGQGILVGKPVSHWLEQNGVEVHKIRSKTENPEKFSREANIIVAGVGKSDLVIGSMVKDGAIVIDFGYGKKDGKMVGDVDYDSVTLKASLITPVPGGMGPILIAAVLKNLIILNEK